MAAATRRPEWLICFGEDWNRHPSTAQFLVRHLLDSFRVLWVESVGWRRPRLNRDDAVRMVRKLRSAARRRDRVPRIDLVVHTPLAIPWHESAAVRALNARLLHRGVRREMARHRVSSYAVLATYPAVEGAVRRLCGGPRVYYCADEYATLPGLSAAMVRSMEDRLLATVDTVIATSAALCEAKAARHPNVVYVPHGVDFEHFHQAAAPSGLVPRELAHLPRPILGFHGLIQELIDVELLDDVARRRPDWSVVLIGRRNFDAVLPERPNVHYLGERPYDAIPEYVRAFDACLIPYRLGPRTRYANPIKLREYLATGKPIVATAQAEIVQFGDLVRTVATGEELVGAVESALGEDPLLSRRRIDAVRGATWRHRAAEVARIVSAPCRAS